MSSVAKEKSKGFAFDCEPVSPSRLTIQQSIDLAIENNSRLAILIDNLDSTLCILLGARPKPGSGSEKETAPCGQVALLDDILQHQSALISELVDIGQQIDNSLN